MMEKEIIRYIKMYGVSTDYEKNEIVEKIRIINDTKFKYLLQYGDKDDWWIESEILIALGYPHVKPVIEKIFEWLQDMNWPGAQDLKYRLLLLIDKHELIDHLSAALRQAYWEGDSDWIYNLSLFTEEANLTRDDFTQDDNAYDIILFYNAIYVDDEPTFNYIDLLLSWGYPRISQFIYYIVTVLKIVNPHSMIWNQHYEMLNSIPADNRISEIKKALRKLYDVGRMNNIDQLREIIPIGDTTEEFLQYISY